MCRYVSLDKRGVILSSLFFTYQKEKIKGETQNTEMGKKTEWIKIELKFLRDQQTGINN